MAHIGSTHPKNSDAGLIGKETRAGVVVVSVSGELGSAALRLQTFRHLLSKEMSPGMPGQSSCGKTLTMSTNGCSERSCTRTALANAYTPA